MNFKCYTVKGILVKIEKIINEGIIESCGIDDHEYISRFGEEQPIRNEYEMWVSQGNIPIFIETTFNELFGIENDE